jgi:hypothetical protein
VVVSRGLRLGNADAEDPRRLVRRIHSAVEAIGVPAVVELDRPPGASVHLELRAPFERLRAGEDGVMRAAVRILERDVELHAGSIAR